VSTGRQLGVVSLLVVLATSSVAWADDGASGVTLEIEPCVRADAAAVRKYFELELGSERTRAADGAQIEVACAGELIELRVNDPLTGKSLSRRIDPGPPAGRNRLIALAVLELLVASWSELETTPRHVVQPAGPSPDPAAASSARALIRHRIPRDRADMQIAAVTGVAVGDPAVGVGVRAIRSGNTFGVGVDVGVRRQVRQVDLGTITETEIGGAVMGLAYYRHGASWVRGAAGARLAYASAEGKADSPDVFAGEVSGAAGGPLVGAAAGLLTKDGLTAGVAVETGYHLLAVRGRIGGDVGAGAHGAWVTAELEVGWTF